MGGIFGVAGKNDISFDLFFGTDYHSHLGTVKGGMAVFGKSGITRVIHNISNSPFRTKFEDDLPELQGNVGVGCISDTDSQPLAVRSHLGEYAICCVGKINNIDEIVEKKLMQKGIHLVEGSKGKINNTEVIAAVIDKNSSFEEGIQEAFDLVDGSVTLIVAQKDCIIAARDKYGRTPLIIGKKKDAMCAASESFSYLNLGYETYKELGAGEIVRITPEDTEQLASPNKEMRICSFLWTYYGYPSSVYENVNVESMRYRCGEKLAIQDNGLKIDAVAGIPDSGTAHAIGYTNFSGIPFTRPFIKYTPTWPRSFMPKDQSQRKLIARMKLLPVKELVEDRELLFIDDSIVRGTQMRETAELLYASGAKKLHIRTACPPLIFGCKYLNFSRSRSTMELITRQTIQKLEGKADDETAFMYADERSEKYHTMVDVIGKELNFTSLKFLKLDDLVDASTLPRCKLCTYCWSGNE